jgi:putative drug exporter of the RND superfamily
VTRERVTRLLVATVVRLRYVLALGWIAAALAVTWYLPGLGEGEPLPLGGLVPQHADSVEVATREAQLFDVPLTTDTVVVQRNPSGLSTAAQQRAVERGVRASRKRQSSDGIALAFPVTNTLGLFPSSREKGTTAITYLFFGQDTTLADRVSGANAYIGQIPKTDAPVGVTGPAPARYRQFNEISAALPIVELGTVGFIFLIVGLTFRSFGAPLLTLFTAAVAFLLARGLIPWVGARLGVSIPQEVEPLVVALTLGIVTDYAVFYLSATRRALQRGMPRVEAASTAAFRVSPIVATAGLIVVAGTAALLVSELEFFRAFGPGLALTAAISLVVSVTLVPPLLAIFGRLVFWPGLRLDESDVEPEEKVSPAREALARFLTSRPIAFVVVVVCTGVLAACALGLPGTKLGFRLINGLPSDTQQAEASKAASAGFAPGVIAPTIVLVQGKGVADDRVALARLEGELAQQPGVAGVIGPREQLVDVSADVFTAPQPGAARFVVILDQNPLGSGAIEDVRSLRDALPGLARKAGLRGATVGVTGQTAIADDTVQAVVNSSVKVGAVVLAVNFVLLALFLQALVAPVYLLAASVASVAATLGLTKFVFEDMLGHSDLTYYVPFAAGVLLVSLGSDYNVYVVGRIWEEARRRPLAEAIAYAAPRASKAIGVAGIALAASFAMLAVVPIDGFREFAFIMAVGVLLETFLVRSLLIPALISTFGRLSFWPGRFRRPPEPEPIPEPRSSASAAR